MLTCACVLVGLLPVHLVGQFSDQCPGCNPYHTWKNTFHKPASALLSPELGLQSLEQNDDLPELSKT
jgi:hypothetical protein